MEERLVDVLGGGAVRLGPNVVCDGFIEGHRYRIQTHVHDDHMKDFAKSKGLQDILLTPQTFDLLVAEFNAELEYRENIHKVEEDQTYSLSDGSILRLLSANHMLGSCQAEVTLPCGYRIGYSGDFGWPLNKIIEVDELVVDSTYGSPESIRNYTQEQAEVCFVELVSGRLRHGPVHISAFRGTIERAIDLLDGNTWVPILATDRLIKEVEIYQKHGRVPSSLVPIGSDQGKEAMKDNAFIRLYAKGDRFPTSEPDGGTSIRCSAYMTNCDSPLLEFSEKAYTVALSNHADFNETIRYIEATKAKKIITDNTRGRGIALANAINSRFSEIKAFPSSNDVKH